jgi:CBS domain-containing protein
MAGRLKKMNHEELLEVIKNQYPFDVLTEEQLQYIVSGAKFTTFNKGEFLFHEEETVDEMDIYFLVSGLAKNILHRSSGKQFSLRFYYPGDLVGLMIMLTSGEMTFSVRAMEKCGVFRFQKSLFFDVMSRNSNFSKIVFDSIGERMKTLYDEIKNKSSQDEDENITLFKTKVQALMDSPVFINSENTILAAAEKMQNEDTYGLVVVDSDNQMKGVLTQREVIQYITQPRVSEKVKDWMEPKPFWIRDESFAYEALSFFKHEDAEFVPVIRNDKVVGVLTSTSFLNIQDSNYLDLSYKIQAATSTSDLVQLAAVKNATFHQFIQDLLQQDSFAYDVCEVISNYNDRLHRKIISLTEKEMRQAGFGPPPIDYCFIVMGSQGRSEQSFHTDQDNGIILDDYKHLENKKNIEGYFQVFTEKLNNKLVEIGLPECTGGIMAKEPKWKRSFSEWKAAIDEWLHEIDAQEVQNFTMFYDFRPIFGDYSLAEDIRNYLSERAKKSLSMQQLLRKDALRFRLPVGPLGRVNIKPKTKSFNIKKSGLMQLVNMIRIHSVKYGVKEVNTVKRLQALKTSQAFHPRDVENAKTALHILLSFRLQQNLQELTEGKALSNEINLTLLSKEDRRKLKEAIQIAHKMQQVMEISFNRNRVV